MGAVMISSVGGNSPPPSYDYQDAMNLTCDACREAVSAGLDAEDAGASPAAVAAHLAGCAGCRQFREAAATLHHGVRALPVATAPELTGVILARIGAEVQAGRSGLGRYRRELRVALAVVATLQLLLALPALLLGSDGAAPIHAARELGSFSAALAVGFMVCAWQPRRIAGLLPVAGALAAFLAITAVLDLLSGRAIALAEASHLLELGGVGLLLLLGRSSSGTTDTPRPGRPVVSR
jgi:predicted anti-sigma-YlaC factor YlaD